MIKTSELIKNKKIYIEPYLHGVLFSRIIETKKFFIAPISFRIVNKFNKIKDKKVYDDFLNILNSRYKSIGNWVKTTSYFKNDDLINARMPPICYMIENDSNISKNEFMKLLYFNLINNENLSDKNLNQYKKDFIRGFFESKGSIDYNAHYYTTDYYYDTDDFYDLKRVLLLVDYFSIPLNMLNINFRNLQKDYLNGKKRNTQVRINLYWYIDNIGLSNILRKESIEENINFIKKIKENNVYYFKNTYWTKKHKINDNFRNRIDFYSNNILNLEKINEKEIDILRKELNFENENDEITRDQNEILKVKIMKPDICYGCYDKYDLKDRTFKRKTDNKYYLEIHHNICYSNEKEKLDFYDNMVKLCPICHAALRKNRTFEEIQKNIIKNIINKDQGCKEFAITYFNVEDDNENEIINNIFNSLR